MGREEWGRQGNSEAINDYKNNQLPQHANNLAIASNSYNISNYL